VLLGRKRCLAINRRWSSPSRISEAYKGVLHVSKQRSHDTNCQQGTVRHRYTCPSTMCCDYPGRPSRPKNQTPCRLHQHQWPIHKLHRHHIPTANSGTTSGCSPPVCTKLSQSITPCHQKPGTIHVQILIAPKHCARLDTLRRQWLCWEQLAFANSAVITAAPGIVQSLCLPKVIQESFIKTLWHKNTPTHP
jgi:hypothetical protein